jgi:hypothetical protein
MRNCASCPQRGGPICCFAQQFVSDRARPVPSLVLVAFDLAVQYSSNHLVCAWSEEAPERAASFQGFPSGRNKGPRCTDFKECNRNDCKAIQSGTPAAIKESAAMKGHSPDTRAANTQSIKAEIIGVLASFTSNNPSNNISF